MKNFRIFLIAMLFLASGCFLTGNKNIIPPPVDLNIPAIGEGVTEKASLINEKAASVKADAYASKVLAGEIEKKTKDNEVKGHATEIKGRSQNQIKNIETIQDALKELSRLNYEILKVQRYLSEVESQNGKLKSENKKLRKDNAKLTKLLDDISLSAQKNMTNILIAIIGTSLIVLAFGIYLLASGKGPKTGMALMISALAMISLSYFMTQYPLVVAIMGGVLFVGFIGSFIYQIVIHKQVIEETTDTVETLKHNDWNDVKDEIKQRHSKHTKKLVNLVKTERTL